MEREQEFGQTEVLEDGALDEAVGGIALLLPAVSAAREAARRQETYQGVAIQTTNLKT